MRPVLFETPFDVPFLGRPLPLFGYGLMLVIAYLVCTRVAANMIERQGGKRETIYDLAFWVFIAGIIAARLFFFIQHAELFDHWYEILFLWKGGLVVYGSALGALVAFLVYTHRYAIRRLWLLDILAPSMALGMGIGRIGCVLFGCCYGDYCDLPLALHFPPNSPAHSRMVKLGYQSRLGFEVGAASAQVQFVEPDSDADQKGLRVGDIVADVNGHGVTNQRNIDEALWELDKAETPIEIVNVTSRRGNQEIKLALHPTHSLPVHPTQIYSSIDGFLLFLFLSSFFPFRRREGEVIALLCIVYSTTRFLIEYLRNDEGQILLGMTISQSISVIVLIVGALLWIFASPRIGQTSPAGAFAPAPSRG